MDIRLVTPADAALLDRVAQGVFDYAVDAALTAEFLDDPRHHLCVAVDDGVVVGMASAVCYVHPDKRPQLWINEVGVAPSHQRRGFAAAILRRLQALGRDLGCTVVMVTFPLED